MKTKTKTKTLQQLANVDQHSGLMLSDVNLALLLLDICSVNLINNIIIPTPTLHHVNVLTQRFSDMGVVMGIPTLFSEPDHLAQFTKSADSFGFQTALHFITFIIQPDLALFWPMISMCARISLKLFNIIRLNLIIRVIMWLVAQHARH